MSKGVIKELNQLIFKFLWKAVDKVTRLAVINYYQKSGLKMIDLKTMAKSLRLAWLKIIFGENDGTWKNYLHHPLKRFGGLFLFHCNYNIKDHTISWLLNSIVNCFSGGQSFVTNFLQRNFGTM